jgi:hypothetical protein
MNVGSERNIREGANANTKPHTNAEQEDSIPLSETTVLFHGKDDERNPAASIENSIQV